MAGGRAGTYQGGASFIDDDELEIDEEGLRALAIVVVILLICTRCFCWCRCCRRICRSCCCRCCCPRPLEEAEQGEQQVGGEHAAASVKVNGAIVEVASAHLRRKKSLMTAYFLWLPFGLLGVHHFYLDRIAHGVLAAWSLNFLGIGWVIDMFMLPVYLRGANKQTAPIAIGDKSGGRLMCRLPWASTVVFAFFIYLACKGPRLLHDVGVLDIDQRIAGTSTNPYDILGVARGAPTEEALEKCKVEFARLRAQPICPAACQNQKSDLRKVNLFFNGTTWRRKPDKDGKDKGNSRKGRSRKPVKADVPRDPWDDWTDFIGSEWTALVDHTKDVVTAATAGSKSSEEDL